MESKNKGERPYRCDVVWLYVKANPGTTATDIDEHFGMVEANKALSLLERSGHIYRVRHQGPYRGKGRPACKWYIKPGSRKPKDGRGRAKGSQEALRIYWRPTPASLANLKSTNPRRIPRPATALERCWGFANFSTLDSHEMTE